MKLPSIKLQLLFLLIFIGFNSHSQPTFLYYDFNSFNGPGDWVSNSSNVGSLNGNMNFAMNGTLDNNSSKIFMSPNYNFSTNTNDINIDYDLNINIRDNVFRFFTDGCFICIRHDELVFSYLDVGGWQVIQTHTGLVNGVVSVTVPSTAIRLRITLNTDPGSTAGYGAEVVELTLDQPVNLPIVLQSFEVLQQNESIQLLWSTSSEINNSHFLIERAGDEGKFLTIGSVEGNGTSASKHHYSFIDFEPLIGNNYYRLTQVDYNGKSESFDPQQFLFTINEAFKIYPNPASDKVNIALQEFSSANLIIQNSHGLKIEEVALQAGVNSINIDHLQNGYYLFKLMIDQQVFIRKIAKFN